ncbi:MAG: leucyl aminopeptidase [Solirubrobacteraceae bacterium]
MDVEATTHNPPETHADTVVVGIFEGEDVAHDTTGRELQALLESGEARRRFRKLAVVHADGKRWVLIGLGKRDAFDGERARVAAGVAYGRAAELGASTLCWEVPHHVGEEVVAGLVEGTLLADYRFDRYKGDDADDRRVRELLVSAHHDVAAAARRAAVLAEAQNAARDLQNAPANDLTPTALGEAARALAAEIDGLSVAVEGREAIEARGMGAFAAVARGSYEDPRLIVLRYEPVGVSAPRLGFVGKAVTFDTGGISIKPAAKMAEMKFDMSGGAAVVEAIAAIARLELRVRVLGVVGATENMPSGRSVKPGDIVRAMNGTTIEVNNTDAEGRMVLADCLAHAVAEGAERLVDLATLTGAVVVALGSAQAGLMGDDDAWCSEVQAAARTAGEPVWRLPLGPDYAEMIKGRYADIVNSTAKREAMTITAAEFLHRFTDGVPWAHLDIAGVAWDRGKPYASKGGSGWGVRTLVELARRAAAD